MRVTMFLFHTFQNDHRVLKEARTLIAAGYEVTLIALRENDDFPPVRVESGIHVRRLRMHRWPFRKGRYLEYFARAAVAAFRQDADVYHCHDLDTLLPGFLAAALRGKPVIYDSHELFTETHFLIGRSKERLMWSIIERIFIRFTSRVITVSEPIAVELARRYGIEKPVLLRNLPRFMPPPEPDPFFPEDERRPLFICQGYMQEGRGLETLIRAMAEVPDGRLILLGDGEISEKLQDLILKQSLEHRVKLLPAVPIRELPSRTADADFGLIAYRTDSLNFRYALPNKFFEYIMAGVPVITSDIPEVSRLVREFDLGIVVDDCTPTGFACAMQQIATDHHRRKRFKENCLKSTRLLCWETEETRLLQVYQELTPP